MSTKWQSEERVRIRKPINWRGGMSPPDNLWWPQADGEEALQGCLCETGSFLRVAILEAGCIRVCILFSCSQCHTYCSREGSIHFWHHPNHTTVSTLPDPLNPWTQTQGPQPQLVESPTAQTQLGECVDRDLYYLEDEFTPQPSSLHVWKRCHMKFSLPWIVPKQRKLLLDSSCSLQQLSSIFYGKVLHQHALNILICTRRGPCPEHNVSWELSNST